MTTKLLEYPQRPLLPEGAPPSRVDHADDSPARLPVARPQQTASALDLDLAWLTDENASSASLRWGLNE